MSPQEIRHIRKRTLKLKQSDFARLLSVSRNTVVKWENGHRPVPDLQAGIIRQLEKEAKRRDDIDAWAQGLLALAVGGLFGTMLAKIFKEDANKSN